MDFDPDPLLAVYDRLIPLVTGNIEWWREGVRRWAAEPPRHNAGILPIPLPVEPTEDEGIALLAAIYDAYATDAARIDPWRDPRDLPELPYDPDDTMPGEYQPAIRYTILVQRRVKELRQHWESHKPAVGMFISEVERQLAGRAQLPTAGDPRLPDRSYVEEGFEEQSLEPEIAEPLARHHDCDYHSGEETEFWRDFAAKLRDALTPHAERLWRDDYAFGSRAEKMRRQSRYWLCKAIERAAPISKSTKLDIAPLLWLRRYINGELPRDEQQVTAVQDLVATLTLAETGKLGEHYSLPEVTTPERTAADGESTGAYAARFVCPPCPTCGGKAKVDRTEGRVRRIKCQSESCGHRWKVSVS